MELPHLTTAGSYVAFTCLFNFLFLSLSLFTQAQLTQQVFFFKTELAQLSRLFTPILTDQLTHICLTEVAIEGEMDVTMKDVTGDETGDEMGGVFPSKPPIIQVIREDHTLPDIARGGGAIGKLGKTSKSARRCQLPTRLVHAANQDQYGSEANRFIDENQFDGLIGHSAIMANPSIKVHSNESDVGRSIDAHINDPVAKALCHGYGKIFKMVSHSQDTMTTKILDSTRLPHEPHAMTLIPDWAAKCQLSLPGEPVKRSSLMMEYKDRDLLPIEEFDEEARLGSIEAQTETAERLIVQAARARRSIRVGTDLSVTQRAHINARYRGLRGIAYDEPELVSTLGLPFSSRFAPKVKAIMEQGTSYLLQRCCRRGIFICWDSMFTMCLPDMEIKNNALDQLRAGPGRTCVITIKRNLNEFPREVLGA
ncbi:hypothetical protein CTA2_4804 [Colletotrichum tanaceti]|uniref:Uncharacterized protein n=1 Tax=Colletotrichum tanaceti TaxID=1306861 RepID=A0A4U6XD28_9PEZI|nr:hypothetical protein CTA2_4804 [Colletotrichum tanaceti]TKW53661.1 hypothetical protein CTA1_5494 [Colletotrichum tanaceti]